MTRYEYAPIQHYGLNRRYGVAGISQLPASVKRHGNRTSGTLAFAPTAQANPQAKSKEPLFPSLKRKSVS